MAEHTDKNSQLTLLSNENIHPELNLEKWTIWRPSKSPNKKPEVQSFEREERLTDGSSVLSRVEVGFTDKGALTTEDRKTYYALIKIWEEKGRPAGEVNFSLRGLARALNKGWGSNTNEALSKSLLRLVFTPITWENSYYNAESGEKEEHLRAFTILEEFSASRKKRDGHVTTESAVFRFNKHILQNLMLKHSKPLHLDTMLTFKTDIAQLLYPYLDLVMAAKTCFTPSSQYLFEQLGLTAPSYKKPANRRKKLEKALEELHGVNLTSGCLESISMERMKSNPRDFKVVFKKTPFNSSDPDAEETAPAADQQQKTPQADPARDLVDYFHQQLKHDGHSPSRKELEQAAALLSEYEDEPSRAIVDYALAEAPKTKFRMQVFGAVLQYAEEALRHYGRRREQQDLFSRRQDEVRQQAAAMQAAQEVELEEFYQTLSATARRKIEKQIAAKIAEMKIADSDPHVEALRAIARNYVLQHAFRSRKA